MAITYSSAAADAVWAAEIHAQGGVLGFVNNLSEEVATTIRTVVTVIAIGFVVYRAVKSSFQVSTIIVSLVVAGGLIWGVHNIDWLQGRVEEEVNNNSAPALELPVDSDWSVHRT